MYFKLGLISVLAATASAFSVDTSSNQFNHDLVYINKYASRNQNEICFTKRPIETCKRETVPNSWEVVNVDFHCVDKRNPLALKWINDIKQNKTIYELRKRFTNVKDQMSVPTSCSNYNSEYNPSGYSGSLHHQKGSSENNLVELSSKYEYIQYNNNYNQEVLAEQDALWTLYPKLNHHKSTSLNEWVLLKENDFQALEEQLYKFSSKYHGEELWTEVQHVLPSLYSQISQKLFKTMNELNSDAHRKQLSKQEHQNNWWVDYERTVADYDVYKRNLKAIYYYIVKEVAILNKTYPYEGKWNVSQYIRRIWQTIQRELTKKQINRIENAVTYVEKYSDLDQTGDELSDWLVDEKSKYVHQTTRRNLLRIILTGLTNLNSNKVYTN